MHAIQEVTGRLLRPEEVANRLGIQLHRVYSLCRQNELPHVRLGSRQIRVDPAALERWISGGGSAGAVGGDLEA